MGKHGQVPPDRQHRRAAPGTARRQPGNAGRVRRAGGHPQPGALLRSARDRVLGQPRRWRRVELAGLVTVVVVIGVLAAARGESGDPAAGRPPLQPRPPLRTIAAPPTQAGVASPSATSTSAPTAGATAGAPAESTGAPAPTGTRPTRGTADLCGAPANPYGYNVCGHGAPVRDWAANVCSYFTCAEGFGHSGGYLVLCGDNVLSTSEATGHGCAHHRGAARPVSGP